jgi:hypothetical protein
LERAYIVPNPTDASKELRSGLLVGGLNPLLRYPQFARGHLGVIECSGIMNHGFRSTFPHIDANPFNDLLGSERFAEQGQRQSATALGHNRAVWTEFLA